MTRKNQPASIDYVQLTHYIVVRRDLPLGVALASVAHAAGESFYIFAVNQFPSGAGSSTPSGQASNWLSEGEVCASQAGGANILESPGQLSGKGRIPTAGVQSPNGDYQGTLQKEVHDTIAIVLGSRNQHRLAKLAHKLMVHDIPHVPVMETDGEFAGQLMAVGLLPTGKAEVYDHLREYHMLSTLNWEE